MFFKTVSFVSEKEKLIAFLRKMDKKIFIPKHINACR